MHPVPKYQVLPGCPEPPIRIIEKRTTFKYQMTKNGVLSMKLLSTMHLVLGRSILILST